MQVGIGLILKGNNEPNGILQKKIQFYNGCENKFVLIVRSIDNGTYR
jgi:hypothetical protein